MRCPHCDEVVDSGMALRAGRTPYLLCWNGHRFGLDGRPAADGATPAPIDLTTCAPSEAAAG